MGFSALEMIVVQYFVFSAGETSDNFKGYHRHDTGLLAPACDRHYSFIFITDWVMLYICDDPCSGYYDYKKR